MYGYSTNPSIGHTFLWPKYLLQKVKKAQKYNIQYFLFLKQVVGGTRARTQRFVFGKTIFAKAKGSALDF